MAMLNYRRPCVASVLWHDGQRWGAAAKTWGVGGPKIWGWVNTYDITIFNMGE